MTDSAGKLNRIGLMVAVMQAAGTGSRTRDIKAEVAERLGVTLKDAGWMLTYLGPSGMGVLDNYGPTESNSGYWRLASDARNTTMTLVSALLAYAPELPYEATP
jgi:hypothetical protein